VFTLSVELIFYRVSERKKPLLQMASSTERVDSYSVTYIGLVTGSFQDTLLSSSTAGASFSFPSITVPTGPFLSISPTTAGVGVWSSTMSSNSVPPTPRNDYYRTRTNEILSINVLTGFSANTGGTDIGGVGPTGVATTIQNVTLVKNVTRGTLV